MPTDLDPVQRPYKYPFSANNTSANEKQGEKTTGIVRRVSELGRIVIPKEIRRILRIRVGGLLMKMLTVLDKYLWALKRLSQRRL